MITAQPLPLTPDEYLQMEAQSPIKHEYINGELYAMAGASDAHVTIMLNLSRPCYTKPKAPRGDNADYAKPA